MFAYELKGYIPGFQFKGFHIKDGFQIKGDVTGTCL